LAYLLGLLFSDNGVNGGSYIVKIGSVQANDFNAAASQQTKKIKAPGQAVKLVKDNGAAAFPCVFYGCL
jgi:hypothetical protein